MRLRDAPSPTGGVRDDETSVVSARRLAPRPRQHRLKAGDVAVVLDRVPHPSGGENGVVLEVFNAPRESLTVITAPESAIEPLREDEVLTVRLLAKVGQR